MTTLLARLRRDDGWAMVTAVLVLGIVVSLALPLMALVDGQQRQTANERKSESSFNLAEAAFDATVFALASDWPGTVINRFPATCTAASTEEGCPSADMLERAYSGADYSARAWTVQVRDDVPGVDYYNPATYDNNPNPISYDANNNAKVWVRAEARAAAGSRSVVALVRRQDKLEPFPRNAVTSGWFATTTSGQKRIVDTKGAAAQPAPLAVRCTEPAPSTGCLQYGNDRGQVEPDTAYGGYSGETAVPEDALQRFRETADALGTYHPSGCPQSPAGQMVFIENGNCAYAGGGVANTPTGPGVLIVARGTLTFAGGMTYHGLVYAANLQGSAGAVVTISGSATISGSVAVDRQGGLVVGSNGDNLLYDDRVFPMLKSFGSAAAVQGTWRELPAS